MVLLISAQALISIVPMWQGRASASTPCTPIVLTPLGPRLPDAFFAVPYSRRITALGVTGRYTFSLVGDALPPGLTLSPNGAITGTVNSYDSSAPPFSFLIRVTDSNGCFAQRPYSIEVRDCSYIAINYLAGEAAAAAPTCDSCGTAAGLAPVPLPDVFVGAPYSLELTAFGGEAPYTFAPYDVEPIDEFPPELTLSSTGDISGIFTTAGGRLFGVVSYDANDCRGYARYLLNVRCPAMKIPLDDLTAAEGTPYRVTLSALGGTAPHTFALDGGSAPPPGLTLSPSGLLRGTPTAPGTYVFEVIATDAYGCTTSESITATIKPGNAPTPTRNHTATHSPTRTASATITATYEIVPTATSTRTVTESTATVTRTATPTSTRTVTPAATASADPSLTPAIDETMAPTASPTHTVSSDSPTRTVTTAVTATSSPSPDAPAATATTSAASPTSTVPSTASPSPSPTHSPTPPAATEACTGDCDGSGDVEIHELVLGVHMILGDHPVDCAMFDANQTGSVDISDLVVAVRHALYGCP